MPFRKAEVPLSHGQVQPSGPFYSGAHAMAQPFQQSAQGETLPFPQQGVLSLGKCGPSLPGRQSSPGSLCPMVHGPSFQSLLLQVWDPFVGWEPPLSKRGTILAF